MSTQLRWKFMGNHLFAGGRSQATWSMYSKVMHIQFVFKIKVTALLSLNKKVTHVSVNNFKTILTNIHYVTGQ